MAQSEKLPEENENHTLSIQEILKKINMEPVTMIRETYIEKIDQLLLDGDVLRESFFL